MFKIIMQLIYGHDIVFDIDGVDIVQEVVQDVSDAKEVVKAVNRFGS